MTSLTALTSTFLYGRNNLRLVKTFRRSGEVLAYPMAKNFTSETKSYALTQAGLRQRLADMQAAAEKGGQHGQERQAEKKGKWVVRHGANIAGKPCLGKRNSCRMIITEAVFREALMNGLFALCLRDMMIEPA